MNIGLFFGTFDPIHLGHLKIAQNALALKYLDKVWLVLTPQNPFKTDLKISSNRHRMLMLNIATRKYDDIVFSDIEFNLKAPQYTSDTLKYIIKIYPEYKFSLIMGSDNYCQLQKWKNGEYILNNFDIYVYSRRGYFLNQLETKFQLSGDKIDISSSQIRQNIYSKENQNMLDKGVLDYIKKNKLYT